MRLLRLALLMVPALSLHAQTPRVPSFRIDTVARDIYAVIRTEGAGHIIDGNSMFIVTDRDVIVVDANVTPASAATVIAALKKITSKPVRYVVNTQFLDDHVLGNQAYARAFPGVEFIAHANTRNDMLDFATKPRQQFASELPGNVAAARDAMKAGNGFDGQPLTPRKRAILVADTLLANHFIREWPNIVVTPPTLLVRDTLTIHRAGRTIDIIHHGRSQTDGALTVFVREDSVLAVGDLVGWPIPYSSPKAFIREWAVSLRQMQKLGARILVPGHGEPIRDTVAVTRLMATLEELQRQADEAARDGLDLAAFRQKLNLREHRLAFTGGDAALDELWRSYFLFMSASRAHEQAARRN